LLGEGEDVRERADDDDLAPAALGAGMDVDPFDQRADDLDRPRTRRLVRQEGLKVLDLLAI